MTVTDIKPAKKGLSSLYIDGEFALKLDTEVLIKNRIDIGAQIDDDTLHDVIQQSNLKRAKDKALWLISYRDHSKKELIDKVSKTSSKEAAVMAADRLEELGLINDEAFARRYANELINSKRLSPSACKRKLIEKGIDRDLISDILDQTDVDIYENIKALINKKYIKSLGDEKGRRKAINGLLRAGYSYADIRHVLSEYTEIDEYNY